jgi:hypothetical protein
VQHPEVAVRKERRWETEEQSRALKGSENQTKNGKKHLAQAEM